MSDFTLTEMQKLIGDATKMSPKQQEDMQQRAQAHIAKEEREGTWEGGAMPHVEYQGRPVDWMVEKLGIPRETIQWSLYPEYQNCTCDTSVCKGGGEHTWDGDKDPLITALGLIDEGKSVAVSAGTAVSKTFTLAAAGTLYWLAVYKYSIALSIAPKRDLLLKNMWKEVGKFWPKFKAMFPDATLLTGQLRMLPGEGQQEVWTASAFGAGVGADEDLAQNLKGIHAHRMLWILEETPGIDQAKIETIINTATDEFNPILALGNPKHNFDSLAMLAARDWVTHIRISGYDFPNVVCDRSVIPGGRSRMKNRRDLEDAAGNLKDPIYVGQVRGIHPDQSELTLIQKSWCEAAAKNYTEPEYRKGPLALGVDPSNSEASGKAAIARWQGACLAEVERRVCPRADMLAVELYQEARELGIDSRNIGSDDIGNAASTINKFKELGFFVRGLNGQAKPEVRIDEDLRYGNNPDDADPDNPPGPVVVPQERFANLRAQMYWKMREDLMYQRIAIPPDEELFEELCILSWDRNTSGKIILMSKDDVKAKLKRSPDRADAAVYGNWVRRRRPEPKEEPPEHPLPNRAYDEHFERMMKDFSVEEQGDFVSRRPF